MLIKKHLFSIMLLVVFLISPVTYAADVPTYQVDVTHSVTDVGKSDAVSATRHESQNTNLDITSLSKLPDSNETVIMVCTYESAESGVFGGDSIGIGRPI